MGVFKAYDIRGVYPSQIDESFAERPATVMSYTADLLTYCPDPPAYYGMIEFEGGGRMMSDFTDVTSSCAVSSYGVRNTFPGLKSA